ncbi:MAG: hypothetical protein JSU79_09780 [Dehalococcoidales bacterium]|nr:MAG: hypothetical protein JSU79_09780 [Dehalococcoidales bacterium]
MKIDRYVDNRIGIVSSDANPIASDSDIRSLKANGFSVIVTVDDYDFNLSWKSGRDVIIRRYQCTFGDYPHPTDWELQHLDEFFLYEIVHSRNIAFWCKDNQVKDQIVESIETFFNRGDESLSEFIQKKLSTQAERAGEIPKKLTHCQACTEKGCITKLVCHVTSVTDAVNIMRTGTIMSASTARGKSGEELALEARNAAGDPFDYFDYVMFTFGNCTAGDRLVMERSLTRMPSVEELNEKFKPGVRFYFRYNDLVHHPGFRSDGYHFCKIKDSIDLENRVVVIIAPETARDILLLEVSPEIKEKLIFVDETEYPDILSWSHQAHKQAVQFF